MKVPFDPHVMAAGPVAEVLGVSVSRVQQLDHLLQPKRGRNGRRLYNPARVAEAIAIREKQKREHGQ